MRSTWKASSRVRRRGNDPLPLSSSPSAVVAVTSNNNNNSNVISIPKVTREELRDNIENATISSSLPSVSMFDDENRNKTTIELMSHQMTISETSSVHSKAVASIKSRNNLNNLLKKPRLSESSITGRLFYCWFNCVGKYFYNYSIRLRSKYYDSKGPHWRRKFWTFMQFFWFLIMIFVIMTTLRMSNQLNLPNTSRVKNQRLNRFFRRQQLQKQLQHQTNVPQRSNSHIGHVIPDAYANIAEVSSSHTKEEVPFFWHIPRALGSTTSQIMSSCMQLTLASDAGARNGHDKDQTLKVIDYGHAKFVNVDTVRLEGIQRAKKLRLAASGLMDVIISSRIHDAATMFNKVNKARLFTYIRHPVHRAVSLFYYTQDTNWRRHHIKEYENINILDYFKSGAGEHDWMTRFLTNTLKRELTNDDLDKAKEILRRKCLIGLYSEKSESMERFITYFQNWRVHDDECLDKTLNWAWPLKHRHVEIEENSEVWDAIVKLNQFDLKLYEYAQQLFKEQAQLFKTNNSV